MPASCAEARLLESSLLLGAKRALCAALFKLTHHPRLVCFHPVPVAAAAVAPQAGEIVHMWPSPDCLRAIFMGRTRYRRQIDLLSHHIS
jgi:hypothetical protein